MTQKLKLPLTEEAPTEATFEQLADWVVWQFPKSANGLFSGAVHPPVANHGWFPAGINPDEKKVTIHAQKLSPFATPESAADWLTNLA